MKKSAIVVIFLLLFSLNVNAEKFPDTKYKNINVKDKITYNPENDFWSKKINKGSDYYIKTKGFGDFYDYLDSNKNFVFTTNCEYEFIYKNNLIGYSNKDLKFYDITYINGGISKRELTKEEIQKIFPEYTVICLSEFSKTTNAYKLKKHIGALKILLINDSEDIFENYKFTSGNAKFERYDLNGFLTVNKPGMIQFAKTEENSQLSKWYVLLIR